MNSIENLDKKDGILKLIQMVDGIKFCFFATDLKNENDRSSTVMTAQFVDQEGAIWFFSGLDSDRNRDITTHKKVHLYFSSPEKNSYLSVSGQATIVTDKDKIAKLWNPLLQVWFKDGVDDTNISLLKIVPKKAHYWDSENQKMINFFKVIAPTITGNNAIETTEGQIEI